MSHKPHHQHSVYPFPIGHEFRKWFWFGTITAGFVTLTAIMASLFIMAMSMEKLKVFVLIQTANRPWNDVVFLYYISINKS